MAVVSFQHYVFFRANNNIGAFRHHPTVTDILVIFRDQQNIAVAIIFFALVFSVYNPDILSGIGITFYFPSGLALRGLPGNGLLCFPAIDNHADPCGIAVAINHNPMMFALGIQRVFLHNRFSSTFSNRYFSAIFASIRIGSR